MTKKKIVYLFGAGATQAVVKSVDSTKSLLSPDIQEEIQKYSSRGIDEIVWNELISTDRDVEHLISVLDTQNNYSISEKVRGYYHNAIVKLSKDLSKDPPINLYSALVDYHNIKGLPERLEALITLNYEDILEQSIVKHFGYDINYIIKTSKVQKKKKTAIKIYKLHGSFNWYNSRPIALKKMTSLRHKDTLWIPPGVDKRKDNYPFNLLWGKVIEDILHCDVLRVIGCSLSRNDWGLIPILYTVQKFNRHKKPIQIEVIDFPKTATAIKRNYRYLEVKSISELPEVIGYFEHQLLSSSKDVMRKEIEALLNDTTRTNPMKEWLEAKAEFLETSGVDLSTDKNYLKKLYYKEL